MRAKKILGVLTVGLFVVASAAQAEPPYVNTWTRQLGTGSYDYGRGVAVDAGGNVYITGYTSGDLGGPNAGGYDTFLSRYDGAGTLAWTRQLGTGSADYSLGVALDADGNVYITGRTSGDLGEPNAGYGDAFLSKYDGAGTLAWTRQPGTGSYDASFGVAVDPDGNVYIVGITSGDLGGPNAGYNDAFLSKYDGSGTLAWTRQLGTGSDDYSYGVAVDAGGNVYITGYTDGNLGGPNAGGDDAFLSKYDGSGTLAWTRQLGTGSDDYSRGVAVDADGNVYITGRTEGDLGGPNAGGWDVFLSKYDGSGTLAWTRQLGTGSRDWSFGVAVDAGGNVFITGWTEGDLGGPNAGSADAFLAKYVVPEPATLALLALGACLPLSRRAGKGRQGLALLSRSR